MFGDDMHRKDEAVECCSVCSVVQVEKAPTVVKTGLKKEEAEVLQKKLEAGDHTLSP